MTEAEAPPGGGWLEIQSCAGRDCRLSACVDRVDDLRRVDALQVSAGCAEVGVPELTLDDVDRDPLAGQFNSVPVSELMWSESASHTGVGGQPAELGADGGR